MLQIFHLFHSLLSENNALRVNYFLNRASLLAFLHRFSSTYCLGTIFQIGKPNYR